LAQGKQESKVNTFSLILTDGFALTSMFPVLVAVRLYSGVSPCARIPWIRAAH
jgi:hypothetical protein